MTPKTTLVSDDEGIKKVWPFIKDMVQASVTASKGRYSMSSVAQGLRDGDLSLWVVWDVESKAALGAALTRHVRYESGHKVCSIELICGKRKKLWAHKLDAIYTQARKDGCREVKTIVSRSWARDLTNFNMSGFALTMAL